MQPNWLSITLPIILGLTSANPVLPPNPNFPSQPQQPPVGVDSAPETVTLGPPGPHSIIETTIPDTPKGPPTVREASDGCKIQGQEVYCCAEDPYVVHSGANMACNVILFNKPEISAMLISAVCPTVPSCCFRTKEGNAITGCSKAYFEPVVEPVVSP